MSIYEIVYAMCLRWSMQSATRAKKRKKDMLKHVCQYITRLHTGVYMGLLPTQQTYALTLRDRKKPEITFNIEMHTKIHC